MKYYPKNPIFFGILVSLSLNSKFYAIATPEDSKSSSSSSSLSFCPCSNPDWCNLISGPPIHPGGEIFGFYGSWVKPNNDIPLGYDMNWTHVTTVAWADHDELMCLAHQHGARAILGVPSLTVTDLQDFTNNRTKRLLWIQMTFQIVQQRHCDGVVFDFEDPLLSIESREGQTYATLIAETRQFFQDVNPSYQITTCVPWSPDGIDGRNYPYKDIADSSDLLYVMDYDTRSQIFDSCIAGANAPFYGMVQGIQRWMDLNIQPQQLILGVPWYGYRYPCLPGTKLHDVYCPIRSVPFRGVNCSDAAGIEVSYVDIQSVLRETDPSRLGKLQRDTNTNSLFFNVILDSSHPKSSRSWTIPTTVYQFWFDDPVSLSQKFEWARQQKLAGVGPFVFRNLDPIRAPQDAIAMWSTFDVFLKPSSLYSSHQLNLTSSLRNTVNTL